jgi:hypothetical protein
VIKFGVRSLIGLLLRRGVLILCLRRWCILILRRRRRRILILCENVPGCTQQNSRNADSEKDC